MLAHAVLLSAANLLNPISAETEKQTTQYTYA